MKRITIDIHPKLENVTLIVKNGRLFTDCLIKGEYKNFQVEIAEEDIDRVKKFAIKHADDRSSNHGNWYAHCNGYAMDLVAGRVINKTVGYSYYYFYVNTYRPYGRVSK